MSSVRPQRNAARNAAPAIRAAVEADSAPLAGSAGSGIPMVDVPADAIDPEPTDDEDAAQGGMSDPPQSGDMSEASDEGVIAITPPSSTRTAAATGTATAGGGRPPDAARTGRLELGRGKTVEEKYDSRGNVRRTFPPSDIIVTDFTTEAMTPKLSPALLRLLKLGDLCDEQERMQLFRVSGTNVPMLRPRAEYAFRAAQLLSEQTAALVAAWKPMSEDSRKSKAKPLGVFDADKQPVIDGKTGKQKTVLGYTSFRRDLAPREEAEWDGWLADFEAPAPPAPVPQRRGAMQQTVEEAEQLLSDPYAFRGTVPPLTPAAQADAAKSAAAAPSQAASPVTPPSVAAPKKKRRKSGSAPSAPSTQPATKQARTERESAREGKGVSRKTGDSSHKKKKKKSSKRFRSSSSSSSPFRGRSRSRSRHRSSHRRSRKGSREDHRLISSDEGDARGARTAGISAADLAVIVAAVSKEVVPQTAQVLRQMALDEVRAVRPATAAVPVTAPAGVAVHGGVPPSSGEQVPPSGVPQ